MLHNRLLRVPWRSLARPAVLTAVSVAVFQACSLFGVTWIMGEGRVVCACVTLLVCVLWASALHALHGARLATPYQAARSTSRQAEMPCDSQVTGPGQYEGRAWPSSWWPWLQAWCAGPVALASCILLQAFGLIDRSGQDPHDKSTPQAVSDLLGTVDQLQPGASPNSAQLWAWVAHLATTAQQPLLVMALPAVLAACHAAATRSGHRRSAPPPATKARGGSMATASCLYLPWRLLAVVCMAEHACVAAWWWVRSVGLDQLSAAALFHVGLGQACDRSSAALPSLCSLLERLTSHRVLHALAQQASADAAAWVSAAAALPLRLLLPRLVYGAAGFVLVTELATGVLRLISSSNGQEASAPAGAKPGISTRLGRHIWLLGCLCAPVTLLLGQRGPPVLLCSTLLLASMAALCDVLARAQTAAWGARITEAGQACSGSSGRVHGHHAAGSSPSKHSAPTPGYDVTAATATEASAIAASTAGPPSINDNASVTWGVICPVCLAMVGVMLFYCTGHFCEFSGLQYTSPFIGFDDMEWYTSAVLLTTNTFGAMGLATLSVPLIACLGAARWDEAGSGSSHAQPEKHRQPAGRLLALAITTHCTTRLLTACTMVVCATVLHKSVVVWAIIAPKVVFELFFLGVTAFMLLIGVVVSS